MYRNAPRNKTRKVEVLLWRLPHNKCDVTGTQPRLAFPAIDSRFKADVSPNFSLVSFIMARQQKVARSIVYAILENDGAKVRSLLSRILTAIAYFFALYQLSLIRLRNDVFKNLRNKWQVDDEDYKDSFGKKDGLQAKGDMGFSGSVSTLGSLDPQETDHMNRHSTQPLTEHIS
jgi:hypothetical protein